MVIYIAAYTLILLSLVIKVGKKPMVKKRNQCIFIFCILFAILALRHPSMGNDLGYGISYGYLGQFTYISELPWRNAFFSQVSSYERGYILYNKLLSLISADPQILLVACAAISLGPLFYMMYRKSNSPAMSSFVFMGLPTFLLLFSGLRQSIALGMCFIALLFIEEKKIVKFGITVAIATLFHYSAWVFLAAYPIYHFSMNQVRRVITYLLLPLIYLFRYPLFQFFGKLLQENAGMDNNNSIVLFLVFCLIYIFCCLFSGERKDMAGLKNLFFTACCIQALAGINAIVMRVGYYYMNSLIILLPMVTGRMRNRKNARILNIIIGVCFVLFGLYSIYRPSWAQAYPYKWFWDKRF